MDMSFLPVETKLAIVQAERQVATAARWSCEPEAPFRDVFPTFRAPHATAQSALELPRVAADEQARELGISLNGSDEQWAHRLSTVRPQLSALVSLYHRERVIMERLDPDHRGDDGAIHPQNRYQGRSVRPADLRAALAGIHFLPPNQGELEYGTLEQRQLFGETALVLSPAKGAPLSLAPLATAIGPADIGRQGLMYAAEPRIGDQAGEQRVGTRMRVYFAPMSIQEYGALREHITQSLTPRDRRRRRELPAHVLNAHGDFKTLFAHWLEKDPELTAARAPRIERQSPSLSMTG